MKKILFSLFLIFGINYCVFAENNFSKNLIHVDTDTVKPDRNVDFTDADYDITFRRIVDAEADSEAGETYIGIVYSRFSPLNCDGTKLLLQREDGWDAGMIYNASTHALIKIIPSQTTVDGVAGQNLVTLEAAEMRWDDADPDIIYFVGNYIAMDGMRLYKYNSVTDAVTTVHDFGVNYPSGDHIMNGVEGSCSNDCRYWAFMVRGPYNGSSFPTTNIIVYDMETDSIIGDFDHDDYTDFGGGYDYLPTPNMVDISPSGNKVIVHWGRCWGTESYGIRPLDIGSIFDGPACFDVKYQCLNPVNYTYAGPDETHSGWAYDKSGNEYFVYQNNRNDWIEASNVETGEVMQLIYHGDIGWNNGFHFARMPMTGSTTGWMLISTYANGIGEDSVDWGDNEIFMIEMVNKDVQTPRVYRLGHTWNKDDGDYRAEGFAAISQFGDKVWWNAKWWTGDVVECFEMDLPDNFESETSPVIPDETSPNFTRDSDVLFTLVMDADTNPLTDSSINGLNATKKAATEPTFNALDIPRSFSSGCVDFDGVDDYIYVSSSIALGHGDFSATFWVKPDISISTGTRFMYLDDEFSILVGTKTTTGGE